ncbi:MAG: hypothetical protein ACLQGP_41845 [Isosphaeraceae bacterium]
MLGSTVLELALGLCVFYIALSLVCSGITQYFSEWRQRRGRILVDILSELASHPPHESLLSSLLADPRIAGSSSMAKTKAAAATDGVKKTLVLPAGGYIDESVFADVLLDLAAGKIGASSPTGTTAAVGGAGASLVSADQTAQLVQGLLAAIQLIQGAVTIALSGPELAKWDALFKDLTTRVDALKGLNLDEAIRQGEAIFKTLQGAATGEGQPEVRARLLDAIGRETEAVLGLGRSLTTAQALALLVQDLPDSPLRSFLIRLGKRGALDPEAVKQAIQDWFSSVNDRVSVEFRNKTKLVLFVIGLAVTLLLNADTLQMANRLVKDQALRSLVTQEAVQLAAVPANPSGASGPAQPPVSSPPASPPSSAAGADSLERLDVPLRWTADDWETLKGIVNPSNSGKFFDGLYKLLGLIITSLALTMGAEFWYNLLRQLVPSLPGPKPPDKSGRN